MEGEGELQTEETELSTAHLLYTHRSASARASPSLHPNLERSDATAYRDVAASHSFHDSVTFA